MPSLPPIPVPATEALLKSVALLASTTPKLHLSQVQVLLTVALNPGMTQKWLSAGMEMPQSSVSHILSYFIDLDWIDYEGIIGSFVPVQYSLTAKGNAFVRMIVLSLLEYKALNHAH